MLQHWSLPWLDAWRITQKAKKSMTSLELAKHLFLFLNSSNIDYVIVGDARGYPDEIQSDIDIVADAQGLRVFSHRLVQYCWLHGVKIVQMFRHEYCSWYFVLSGIDEKGKICFLHPDVCGDYFRFGRLFLTADELLNGRTKLSPGDNCLLSFCMPAPAQGFIYYLLKKIDKGQLTAKHGDYLSAEWKKNPDRAEAQLKRFWSATEVALLKRAAETNEWTAVSSERLRLQHMLRSGLPFPLKHRCRELLRKIIRIAQPTGMHLVFLGTDGSGKSTVIQQVEKDLAPAFRRTKRYHLRPFFGRHHNGRDVPVTDPHGKAVWNVPCSLAKLGWWWLDYALGYFIEVFPHLVRSTLVLFDRYYDDLLVDYKRYRYGGPLWLARLVGIFIPRPDLVIFLDAPADVLRKRKQEVPAVELTRQRSAYQELIRKLPNGHVVDASLPFDRVVAQVETLILDFMEKRTSKRLGMPLLR